MFCSAILIDSLCVDRNYPSDNLNGNMSCACVPKCVRKDIKERKTIQIQYICVVYVSHV